MKSKEDEEGAVRREYGTYTLSPTACFLKYLQVSLSLYINVCVFYQYFYYFYQMCLSRNMFYGFFFSVASCFFMWAFNRKVKQSEIVKVKDSLVTHI